MLLAVLAIAAAVGLMAGRRNRAPGAPPSEVVTAELRLDPNTATPEALATLPSIGPTLARRIAEARADGPFRSPEEIRARVRGIGPATLARIEPYLRIEAVPQFGPRPDSPEVVIADAATNAGERTAPPSRKPPRSRTRKAKGSSVQLAAKAGASASP